jgi:hypothetical protein
MNGRDIGQIPRSITTPDVVESKIGRLEFADGYPTVDTATRLRDELNYVHGVQAFMNSIQGVSVWALRKGFADAGIADNEFILFSELMDSTSLFLTANADTVYFWGNVNLADGPMVLEVPSNVLGVIDDLWFRWVGDFGAPGPDRGLGGRYLLVPDGYDGSLPEGGYFVYRSRTSIVTVAGRAFLVDGDPAPAVANIREHLGLYPYAAGGFGNSVGQYLRSNGPLGPHATPQTPRFVEGSGRAMNTVAPNDFGHFEMLNELVQHEPAAALDPELAGQFAAIGIRKGETFAPDARLRAILEDAAATGNAASRMVGMGAHPDDRWRYYDEPSAWWNPLFEGGFEFLDPPPEIAADGTVEPYPSLHTRRLNSRTAMFYTATLITPAMCMRLANIGSQYLVANLDSNGDPLDGARTYRMVLPAGIPAAAFWSVTVYDNQTRSMLRTTQRFPRAGSQEYPTPAATPGPDGSTTITFGPQQPDGVADGNWIQTDPDKGWFPMLRLYSPLPSFFDKTWRVGEVELVD